MHLAKAGINTQDELEQLFANQDLTLDKLECPLEMLLPWSDDQLNNFATRAYQLVDSGVNLLCDNKPEDNKGLLALWVAMSRSGFSDRATRRWFRDWEKPYKLRTKHINYDWMTAIVEQGIEHGDYRRIYHDVLGSPQEMLEAWLKVLDFGMIVEPMGNGAELCYYGSFKHPKLHYYISDIEESARDYVRSLPNNTKCNLNYEIADIRNPNYWHDIKIIRQDIGKNVVAFIGKQSICYFNPQETINLIKMICDSVDYLIIEAPSHIQTIPANDSSDCSPGIAREMGYTVDLYNKEGMHPLTRRYILELRLTKADKIKVLDAYHWRAYLPSEIVLLAEMAGTNVYVEGKKGFIAIAEEEKQRQWSNEHHFMLLSKHTLGHMS